MKSPKSKVSSVDKLETVKDEDSASGGKISNFNEYQHIYTQNGQNEANVNWVIRLRSNDTAALLAKH